MAGERQAIWPTHGRLDSSLTKYITALANPTLLASSLASAPSDKRKHRCPAQFPESLRRISLDVFGWPDHPPSRCSRMRQLAMQSSFSLSYELRRLTRLPTTG